MFRCKELSTNSTSRILPLRRRTDAGPRRSASDTRATSARCTSRDSLRDSAASSLATTAIGMAQRLKAVTDRPVIIGIGISTPWTGPYPYAFGANPANALEMDLTEPFAFLQLLESLGIRLVCLTAGSPYYNPHLQRPALTPPSDGYLPPEDPLAGARPAQE